MGTSIERCGECGSALTDEVCGTCAPTGRPIDKGERRRAEAAAAREKELWAQHLLPRKVHERPAPKV